MIYQSRTPPRSNGSTQLHTSHNEATVIRNTINRIKKRIHLCCANLTICSLIQARPIMVESIINLLGSALEWSSRMLNISVSLRRLSLRRNLSDLSIFSRLKTDFKNNFYTEFSTVINGLAIYLIDYRGCIFIALVQQYSQLIH